MTTQEIHGVTFLTADSFTAAGGAVHGFSTRLGGVSTGIFTSLNLGTTRGDDPACVRENYRRFCGAIGADVTKVVMTRQVHSDCICAVGPEDAQRDLCDPVQRECDGLITNVPGVALTVFTADCIPVLLYDPVARVIAAVHAGWRGTSAGIAGKAVRMMQRDYGSQASDILAAIGPGISRCCFETHADVPDAMRDEMGELADPNIDEIGNGKYLVDLKGMNAAVLKQAGLGAGQIEISADCTACKPDVYWSHRITQGQRGNQASMIQLLR